MVIHGGSGTVDEDAGEELSRDGKEADTAVVGTVSSITLSLPKGEDYAFTPVIRHHFTIPYGIEDKREPWCRLLF